MPHASKISSLPDDVRAQLDQRLRSQGFSNILEVTDWLRDAGYPVGKSSVGRYSMRLRDGRLLGERIQASDGAEFAVMKLRLECAAIAAASGATNDLFQRAEQILRWATEPLA